MREWEKNADDRYRYRGIRSSGPEETEQQMNKGGSECRSMQGQHVVISWHGYQFALILLLQARISIKVNPSTKRWNFFGATPRRGVGQKRGQWHESIVLITNMQLPHRARRACFASSSWKLVASLSSSWTATSPERGERERLLQSNSYSNHYFRVYPTKISQINPVSQNRRLVYVMESRDF